ncbi:MAG: 30S ribosomal protein S20 [Chlorobi bacterium]|nr:30S ribosomal protein S20 [Chlorobiota bacterium]
MAHHKSAQKRIRQNRKRRLHNRFYHKVTRTHIKKLRRTEEYETAKKLLPVVVSMIDKLAKRGIIHKNKAANLKAKLMRHVDVLAKSKA